MTVGLSTTVISGDLGGYFFGNVRNKASNITWQYATPCWPVIDSTRKPCYRKDDSAMRPIYGCPQNFRESLATPTATFPEIVNGLLLQSIVLKCVQNLKFV